MSDEPEHRPFIAQHVERVTEPFERHITLAEDALSPVETLVRETGLSRQRIKHAMTCGAVWLTHGTYVQRLRRAKKPLQPGDILHLYYSDAVLDATIDPPRLIADEGAYSVWYKPFGVRSQGSKWGDHCTVYRWAEQHLKPERPAFTLHRLDMAATGLMLVGHEKKATAAIAKLFQKRQIEKRYRAVVHGRLETSDSNSDAQPLAVETAIDGRDARTFVTVLETADDRSLLDVRIETGRKHQIRRHLAELGHPVVGDRLYGRDGDAEDLQLTACLLAFHCPIHKIDRTYRLSDTLVPTLAV